MNTENISVRVDTKKLCSSCVATALPYERQAKIEARAAELATLKDPRQAVAQTQEELAAAFGIGQDTISRLEKRSDMLLSTLRRHIEAMGGKLELVAKFLNRPPLVIDHLAGETSSRRHTGDIRVK